MKFLIQLLIFAAVLFSSPPSYAADSEDRAAIDALLARYRNTEDAGNMTAQAKLMSADRVWINQAGVRRTNNAENMRIQRHIVSWANATATFSYPYLGCAL